MNILDEINQISILQVAEDLGLEVQRHRMKCPFHEDDTPSLVLYSHTNSFYCFGCAKTGNSITLYSEILDSFLRKSSMLQIIKGNFR